MKTVQELINHLNTYKDAVVIIGNGILDTKSNFSIDDFNKDYNRKNLVRNPEILWNFFINNIYKDISINERELFELIYSLDDITNIYINQNILAINNDKLINLHGSVNTYTCSKCKASYTNHYITSKEPYNNICEKCNNIIRPTVLLSGERYNIKNYNTIQEAINNTHTIILIGMDYSEDILLNLIAKYGDIKNLSQANDKILVAIQSKEEEFNPNDLTHFNFIVKDDIKSALNRLIINF